MKLRYRINEAAALLGVSRRTVYNMLQRGQLPYEKAERGARYIPADDLHTLVEARKALAARNSSTTEAKQ